MHSAAGQRGRPFTVATCVFETIVVVLKWDGGGGEWTRTEWREDREGRTLETLWEWKDGGREGRKEQKGKEGLVRDENIRKERE